MDKSIFEKTTAWPFVEARKLLKERKSIFDKKGKTIASLNRSGTHFVKNNRA